MSVTFEDSSAVSVQAADGRWFDVRIVPDDGASHIAKHVVPTHRAAAASSR